MHSYKQFLTFIISKLGKVFKSQGKCLIFFSVWEGGFPLKFLLSSSSFFVSEMRECSQPGLHKMVLKDF